MTEKEIQDIIEILFDKEIDTLTYYFKDYSSTSEKREQLHDEIINDFLNREFYESTKKAFFLGGAPANGKSTFLKGNADKYPTSALKIDTDEIKKLLPEYAYMIKNQIVEAASLTHEESSVIGKKLKKEAINQGINIVIDGVANHTIAERKKVYEEFKNAGYYVIMHYVSLDTNLSFTLAKKRAKETGREVPKDFIKRMNKAIALLVPELIEKQLFDELYLWDTNNSKKSRLILRHINGNLEIVEADLYENFKKKGL